MNVFLISHFPVLLSVFGFRNEMYLLIINSRLASLVCGKLLGDLDWPSLEKVQLVFYELKALRIASLI
ncbi:hypothetical protein AQUCO_00200474v1 [Aquilegia coerulea]|uniref:Uncharacterized protein n=1 Tax=Aquilegia coerulea TaxID=218851 RepID=A0A2G5F3C9_AQUCA|nr:hypothetical protein AQUCO_00200474v1 [Aquilegia coerulea]